MRLYDDFLSRCNRGFRDGVDFSVRHFWYTAFLGFCLGALALSILSVAAVNKAKEMAQPKVYRINYFKSI